MEAFVPPLYNGYCSWSPISRCSCSYAQQRRCHLYVLAYRLLNRHSYPGSVSFFSFLFIILLNRSKAYLTNPSENSFRAYLTEQSFRYHLSRLDNADDVNLPLDRFHSQTISKTSTPSSNCASTFTAENAPSFHFANRASISLRTPKHVFHSFAIFTIAAILPSSKSSNRERQDVCMISDSWYIGAFGKWWKGGVLEEWYQDVIARSKDEESWTSGILNMKRLDMLDYKGLPFCILRMPPGKF